MTVPTLLAREGLLKKVDLALTALQINVSSQNALRLFDINTVSEDFFAHFLGVVYDLALVNLNVISKSFPAIDLGDRARRHSIQITSDGTKTKVKETIDKFCAHGLGKDFDHVQVIIIGKRRGKYTGLGRSSSPAFDPKSDVKGVPELLVDINKLNTAKLVRLCDIIDLEMPVMKAFFGTAKPTDIEALKEYRAYFNRAALQDSLRGCGKYKDFATALGDLIGLLNTGVVKGQAVTKRRTDFDNPGWQQRLENLYDRVRTLREEYTLLVRSGEIDEKECTCKFRNHSMYETFEGWKRGIVDQLNAVLHEAKLPPIRGVSGRGGP